MSSTVLCIDVGVNLGFAYGPPGSQPVSGSLRLKRPDDRPVVALDNLDKWATKYFEDNGRPYLLAKEAPLHLGAFKQLGNAARTVILTHNLHSVLEMVAYKHSTGWVDIVASTIRKHFIGSGRGSSRAETKRAVVQRCHILGYMPLTCIDDNRGDALALWDYACATYGRSIPRDLHLFGEGASA